MINQFRKEIDREIKLFLKDVKKRYGLEKISQALYSGIEDFVLRDGKRIRPILFLMGYRGYSGNLHIPYKKVVRTALSTEFLHDFLLAHDDVIDQSDLRRGKPTLHKLYNSILKEKSSSILGEGLSIVAGDIIFAFAVEAFMSIPSDPRLKEKAMAEFMAATVHTGAGEFIDVVGGKKSLDKLTEREVFLVYKLKTARYTFQGPLVMGAILGGAKEKETQKLSLFGELIGQAFQVQDDMLDIFLSSGVTGKPGLSDLVEGKKTLLVWKAYSELYGKTKRRFGLLFEKKRKTEKDLAEIKELIEMTSAPEYCLAVTDALLKDAYKILGSLKMKKEYRTELEAISRSFFSATEAIKKGLGYRV